MYQYLKDETHHSDPAAFKKQFLAKKQFELNYRYFFVSNKKCRVVYLNNEVTRYPNQLLLIFNSNLYSNMFERGVTAATSEEPVKCFYLDKASQTLYFTVSPLSGPTCTCVWSRAESCFFSNPKSLRSISMN